MIFPIDAVRASFPALSVTDAGRPRIYFDAPGGTQVCAPAIAAMVRHLERGTANAGGMFASSVETDALSDAAHQAMADLLGADAAEIAFGPNMTSLTLAISRALAQQWTADDELVVTRLDHDANIAPWLRVAEDRGMKVRWLDFNPDTGALDVAALPALLNPRTRLVAVGAASNALGTSTDIAAIAAIIRKACDALVFVDAVQSVPHGPVDVRALGCDLLVCSPYKFFGPHQGVLWGRREILEGIAAYKVRPARSSPAAARFETGTPSFEAQAGVAGTIDYFNWLGGLVGGDRSNDRRTRLRMALAACAAYESELGERLLAGLATVPGLKLYGPPTMSGRVPTFAFTIHGRKPADVARALADRNIFVWAGHFYAVEVIDRLGLAETGGLVRVGLAHYTLPSEVDALVEALNAISASSSNTN